LRVLTVGSSESNRFVRDMLRSRPKWKLFAATCVGDLYVIPASCEIDITILHDTFTTSGWSACFHYLRHRWPAAVTVRIPILDGLMVDEKMLCGPVRKEWFSMIEQLAMCAKRGSRCEIDLSRKDGAWRRGAGECGGNQAGLTLPYPCNNNEACL